MYIRNRKAFRKLCQIIRTIEADPDDIEMVKELNLRILKLVLDSEKAIARHKDAQKLLNTQLKTGRGDKKSSRALRTKLKRAKSYIKAQRDQTYIWKCFGDALAYIYLDTLSIKHAFYNTDDYEVKQDAGGLLGKKGMVAEVSLMLEAIDKNVPAVLCDITNTLRFGDVCLLGSSDPILIEVKTSSRLNQRGLRQQAKLNKLHDFMDTDSAEDFRGHPGPTKRISIEKEPRYNLEAFNECIAMAKSEGQAVIQAEKGITYVVFGTDVDVSKAFSSLDLEEPEVYDLNSYKNSYSWAPYTPFLLSIRDTEHALDFIEGRLYIIIILEPIRLCEMMRDDEWKVRYRADDQYSIQCLHLETNAFTGLSSQFVSRAAFEFMSLAGIVETQKQMLEKMLQFSIARGGEIEKKEHQRLLIEKLGPNDEWTKHLMSSDK